MFESAVRADAQRRQERVQLPTGQPDRRIGCGPSLRVMAIALFAQLMRSG